MKLLLVNPNTTAAMTGTAARAAAGVAAAGTVIEAVTSAMGPESIEGYYDEALAVPGLLHEIARGEQAGADAAIIACFDDTGLDAARSLAAIPVVGLCEAAVATASFVAPRFSIVTTLPRSITPIEHLVARYGMAGRASVRASGVPVLALEDPDSGAHDRILQEIQAAIREDRAEAIILGCAGMASLARALSQRIGMPVIDGVCAAVKQAEALVSLGLRTAKGGAYATPAAKRYAGLLAPFAPR